MRLVLLLGAYAAVWIMRLVTSVATAADGGRSDFVFRLWAGGSCGCCSCCRGQWLQPWQGPLWLLLLLAVSIRDFRLAPAGGGHCCG